LSHDKRLHRADRRRRREECRGSEGDQLRQGRCYFFGCREERRETVSIRLDTQTSERAGRTSGVLICFSQLDASPQPVDLLLSQIRQPSPIPVQHLLHTQPLLPLLLLHFTRFRPQTSRVPAGQVQLGLGYLLVSCDRVGERKSGYRRVVRRQEGCKGVVSRNDVNLSNPRTKHVWSVHRHRGQCEKARWEGRRTSFVEVFDDR
jgi:hypothetical protein